MKYQWLLFFISAYFLISSCSDITDIEKRKYRRGYYLKGFSSDNGNDFQLISDSPGTIAIPTERDSVKILTISSKVGDLIDSTEKAKYHLFPYWDEGEFLSAQFVQNADGSILLLGTMKDGTIKKMSFTKAHYDQMALTVFGEKIIETKPTVEIKTKEPGVLTINSIVGDTIDPAENIKYRILPKLEDTYFKSGQFIRKPNGKIVFECQFETGATATYHFSEKKYKRIANNHFSENEDYYNIRKASRNATLAIIYTCFFWLLLIPLIFAAVCAVKAYKYGRLVTTSHPKKEKYPGKTKAQYAVVIGIIGYTIMAIIGVGILFLLASVFL